MSATAKEPRKPYLPAMGHDRLLPFYDPLQRLLGMESVHRLLVDQARIQPDQRILEIGCGTGNLAILIKRLHPDAEVVGIDPDPKALARAQRKARREALSVHLDRGFAEELPYLDASFDRVLSALMFHHLGPKEKEKTLDEARRVSRIRRRSPIESRSLGASPTTAPARRVRGPTLSTLGSNLCVHHHQRSVDRLLDRFRSPRATRHAAPAATPTSTSTGREGHDEKAPKHRHRTECPPQPRPNEGTCAHEGQGRVLQGGHRHPPSGLPRLEGTDLRQSLRDASHRTRHHRTKVGQGALDDARGTDYQRRSIGAGGLVRRR